jgi:hypothetical protein
LPLAAYSPDVIRQVQSGKALVSGDTTLERVQATAGSHSVGSDVGDVRAVF